jgi:hypothetical protein
MTDTKTAQRINFMEAGYDVIPLRPASKLPLRTGWQKRPTVSQWYDAPTDSNLGLRAGNGVAFLDCDDKTKAGTFENVTNWLAGLGHNCETLPIVQTASGIGRHVYVNFTGNLLGSRRNFVTTFGAGDFRYGPASYVATFPDVIADMGEYKLLQGDITRLPVLDLHDIASLVDINKIVTEAKQCKRPSALALDIMQGVKPERYATASEAEAGLVLSLHNSGYTYEDIKHVFESNPCLGHYASKHKAKSASEAERWLYMTYRSAVTYSQNESKVRSIIAEWMELARVKAWSKVTDKNLFLGHLGFAHQAGRYAYAASVRDLSLSAGVVIDTVKNGNKRLVKNGLLSVVKFGKGMSATEYRLESAKIVHSLRTQCEGVYENGTFKIALDDAFMNGKGRLGRRAGEIYALLMSEALTFKEIQARTDTPIRTLRRILGKLRSIKDRKTGEVIEMVSLGGDGAYYGNLVDLGLVSAIMGTYGATGKRRDEYERDRRDHARALEVGAAKRR